MNRTVLPFVLALATFAMAIHARQYTAPDHATEAAPRSSEAPHPLILQEADGEHLVHTSGPLRGLPFTIKIDGENGNAQDFFIFTEILPRGQSIPFHKHENAEEILMLEEGGATVMVGDKWSTVGPQAMVFIPRDTWISVRNTGKQDIHTVAIFSRQGFERYLRTIGAKPGTSATPVSADELPHLRALGHAMYWDTSKGKYPPGVAHP